MGTEALVAGFRWAGPMKSGPFGVLMALLEHASTRDGGDWIAFPSIERLVAFTKQSDSTVRQNIKLLIDEGFITQRLRTDKKRTRADAQYEYVIDLERLKGDIHRFAVADDRRKSAAIGWVDHRRKPATIVGQSPPDSGAITAGIRGDHRRILLSHIEEPESEPLNEQKTCAGELAQGSPASSARHIETMDPAIAAGFAGRYDDKSDYFARSLWEPARRAILAPNGPAAAWLRGLDWRRWRELGVEEIEVRDKRTPFVVHRATTP